MIKVLELSHFQLRALVAAWQFAQSCKLDVSSYEIEFEEEGNVYLVTFMDAGKPAGLRGSRIGHPQPTLKIDKQTGEVIAHFLNR